MVPNGVGGDFQCQFLTVAGRYGRPCVFLEKLFEGEVGKFFTMSWVDFFDFFFKGCLPITTYLFLILLQEKNGNQLQRYQGFLIGLSLLLLWVLSYFFKNFMANANSGFTSLFMLPYVAMFVLIEVALERTSVPSRKRPTVARGLL